MRSAACHCRAQATYFPPEYARRAALRGDGDADKADAAMGEAAQAAYKRQRALAAEALS